MKQNHRAMAKYHNNMVNHYQITIDVIYLKHATTSCVRILHFIVSQFGAGQRQTGSVQLVQNPKWLGHFDCCSQRDITCSNVQLLQLNDYIEPIMIANAFDFEWAPLSWSMVQTNKGIQLLKQTKLIFNDHQRSFKPNLTRK